MTALTGKTPSTTYKDLLQISNSNSGIDTTVRNLEDGEGTVGPFAISTTTFRITSSKSFDMASGSLLKVAGTNLTKGGIVTGTGAGAVVVQAVGSNGKVLQADSATANGVKWNSLGWELIAVASAASSSALGVLALTSEFDYWEYRFDDLVPTVDGADLYVRVAVSSAYQSGATDYEHSSAAQSSTSATVGGQAQSQGDTKVEIAQNISSVAGEGATGKIEFAKPSGTGPQTMEFSSRFMNAAGTAVLVRAFGTGVYNGATSAINGIQIVPSSGVIATGVGHLYALRK